MEWDPFIIENYEDFQAAQRIPLTVHNLSDLLLTLVREEVIQQALATPHRLPEYPDADIVQGIRMCGRSTVMLDGRRPRWPGRRRKLYDELWVTLFHANGNLVAESRRRVASAAGDPPPAD